MLVAGSQPSESARPLPPSTVLRGHCSGVSVVAFLPTRSPMLASGDHAGDVLVWDLSVRRTTLRFRPDDLLESATGGSGGRAGAPTGVLSIAALASHGPSDVVLLVVQTRRQIVYLFSVRIDEEDDDDADDDEGGPRIALLHAIPTPHYGFCNVAAWRAASDSDDQRSGRVCVAVPGDGASGLSLHSIPLQFTSVGDDTDAATTAETQITRLGVGDGSAKCGEAMCLHAASDGGLLAAGFEGGQLAVFDLKDGTSSEPRMLMRPFSEPCVACHVDSHSSVVFAGSAEGMLHCYRLGDSTLVWSAQLRKGIGGIALTSDQRVAIVGGWDSHVIALSARSGHTVTVLTEHEGAIGAVTAAPADATVAVIRAISGTTATAGAGSRRLLLSRDSGGTGNFSAVALASGAADGTVVLWALNFELAAQK